MATTDSTASDDDTPPPLPAKTRESDYSNLSDKDSIGLSDYSSPIITNNIMVGGHVLFFIIYIYLFKFLFYLHIQPLPLVDPQEPVRPPTPPPKKPPMKAPM